MIDWDIEKALHLLRVQIQREYPAHTRRVEGRIPLPPIERALDRQVCVPRFRRAALCAVWNPRHMGAPSIDGVGHVDLTVRDAERSAQWWEQVMGFKLVNIHEEYGRKGYGMFHRCGLSVVLVEHPHTTTERFDEQAIGLDHLAFRVADRGTLEAWAGHLDTLGIAHSGIQEENGGPLIVFRDPDNIQLEVWAFDMAQVTMNRG